VTREIEAIPVWHNGVKFRSLTEGRWSAFLLALGVAYEYEPGRWELSTGGTYLPDFWIPKFKAYLEVKPANEAIRHLERHKAEQFALDRPGFRHWISRGSPVSAKDYIQVLDAGHAQWTHACILEDRRDEGVFWLSGSDGNTEGAQSIGGWGRPTIHERDPIESKRIRAAYLAANCIGKMAA